MRIPILFMAVVLPASPAFAHGLETHRRIVRDAIEHSPPGLREFLRTQEEEVLRGAVWPDTHWMDRPNHVCTPGESRNPSTVRHLADTLVRMSRNGAPADRVAFLYGALSHYVSDISQPLHTVEAEGEAIPHLVFERMNTEVLGWTLLERPYRFRFDGRHDPIPDVRAWQLANVEWSRSRAPRLLRAAKRLKREAMSDLWAESVNEGTNDVIDVWAEIHRRGGSTSGDALCVQVDRKGRLHVGEKRVRAVEADAVYLEVDLRYGGKVENVRSRRISWVALNGRSRFSNACLWLGDQVSGAFEGD
ncbi:MAG: zinc dependent phospholipase C family protein [Planctomycetes bacterium]|nr:zinc dependent phospholipase C family protein [Planctomycetota bacterium]